MPHVSGRLHKLSFLRYECSLNSQASDRRRKRRRKSEQWIPVMKKTESAFQMREYELLGIIETIPAMLWSASPDGEPTHLSQRFLEYRGASFEEFVNRGWERFIHPDDREE